MPRKAVRNELWNAAVGGGREPQRSPALSPRRPDGRARELLVRSSVENASRPQQACGRAVDMPDAACVIHGAWLINGGPSKCGVTASSSLSCTGPWPWESGEKARPSDGPP